jgi:hypothetical protein
VLLAGGVTLWGACVAETIVARSDWEEYAGTITLRGRGALRNLRIGGRLAGIWATNRGRVIDVQDVVIAHAVDIGWLVGLGATATGRNVVIRDTESNADRMFGRALDVNGGSQLELSRAVVRRNREVGIGADGAETRVVLSDIAVSDTVFQESDEEWGEGLAVSGGATVEVTRGAIEHNQDIGVYVLDEGTTVLLADVVVRDTQANEGSGWYGIGLDVERGARAEVTKGLFERNREAGVTVIRDGSIVVLTDVVVRDTMGRMTGGVAGRGLNVQDGAEAHVTRAAFERNREHGILAGNEGTTLTLEDVVVRDTLSQEATPEFGRGLIVQEGARAEVARALFQGNREGGIVAHAGAEVTIEDVVVRDTLSREGDGKMGRGLHAEQGAQVEVARALLEGNREASVLAGHEGTSVQMEDVVVRNTLPAACEDESCPGRGGGSGVVSLLGATVELTRFVVTGSAVCGVQLASGGAVDLHHGAVFGNEVCGVNVQDVEFDIDRLFDDVLLYRNGLNLDTTEWPLPDPGLSP